MAVQSINPAIAASASRQGERVKDDDIMDATRQAGEGFKESAESAAENLKQTGETFVAEQKNKAANELSTWGTAVRSAAQRLREEDDPHAARYAEMAAERLDGIAHFIGDQDLRSLLSGVERAARRRPELFLGGMFLVGLGISRFLKASRSDSMSDY